MKVTGYGHSVIGGREMNQDSLLIDNTQHLYAVADGVGGGLRGDDASRMAVEGLAAEYTPGLTLKPIMVKLAENVLQEALASCGGEALMGTTLTAVQVTGDLVNICHVGDSRAYYYDGTALRQLTEDHEAYDETLNGPVLCSYLGLDTRVHPLTVQVETLEVKSGDRMILCSDGLYKQLTEMQIVNTMRQFMANPKEMLETLCRDAAKADYSDNVTVVYIEFET